MVVVVLVPYWWQPSWIYLPILPSTPDRSLGDCGTPPNPATERSFGDPGGTKALSSDSLISCMRLLAFREATYNTNIHIGVWV